MSDIDIVLIPFFLENGKITFSLKVYKNGENYFGGEYDFSKAMINHKSFHNRVIEKIIKSMINRQELAPSDWKIIASRLERLKL